jgi:hypothetical protein
VRDKPTAVVWDMHGCLSDTSRRRHLLPVNPSVESDWTRWSLAQLQDRPVPGAIARMRLDHLQHQVHVVTAQSTVAESLARAWLDIHADGAYDYFGCRDVEDRRPDHELKVEYIRGLQALGTEVVLAYEDLPSSAEAIYEQTGVPVLGLSPFYPDEILLEQIEARKARSRV